MEPKCQPLCSCNSDVLVFNPSALRPGGVIVVTGVRPSVRLSVRPFVRLSLGACLRDNSKSFYRNLSKLNRDITWVKTSDKFDHGGRSSLNMRIISGNVSFTFFAFLNSFFNLEPSNLV